MNIKKLEFHLERDDVSDICFVAEDVVDTFRNSKSGRDWAESWANFKAGRTDQRPEIMFVMDQHWFLESVMRDDNPVFYLYLCLGSSQAICVGFTEIVDEA